MLNKRLSIRASEDDLSRWHAASGGSLAEWVRTTLDNAAALGSSGLTAADALDLEFSFYDGDRTQTYRSAVVKEEE
jgi:hypothetical protein